MSKPATPKPMMIFKIEPALLERINTFWHKHRFDNRAAAIKWLLDAALKANLTPKESK